MLPIQQSSLSAATYNRLLSLHQPTKTRPRQSNEQNDELPTALHSKISGPLVPATRLGSFRLSMVTLYGNLRGRVDAFSDHAEVARLIDGCRVIDRGANKDRCEPVTYDNGTNMDDERKGER
jgi:hypothetical protein